MKSLALISSILCLSLSACVAESEDPTEGADESGDEVTAKLDPNKKPGQNLDLSHFKLQLPIQSGDGVVEIDQPKLATFTSANFFTAPDGAMTVWTPVTGGHTPSTHYPRTELREVQGGDWGLDGTHAMTVKVRVLQEPSSKSGIMVGQIHGHNGNSEILKLCWRPNGDVEAQVEDDKTGVQDNLLIGNYPIGKPITYAIKMQNRKLTVTVTDARGSKSVSSLYKDAQWDTDKYYFKLGAYVQDNEGPSTEGGKVSFYSLKVQHGS